MSFCNPNGTECTIGIADNDFNCAVSCNGFYGDILQQTENKHGMEVDFEVLQTLKADYIKYKKKLVSNILFDSSAKQPFSK